jgi:hypothetical protein
VSNRNCRFVVVALDKERLSEIHRKLEIAECRSAVGRHPLRQINPGWRFPSVLGFMAAAIYPSYGEPNLHVHGLLLLCAATLARVEILEARKEGLAATERDNSLLPQTL